jgi:hypothetical protein
MPRTSVCGVNGSKVGVEMSMEFVVNTCPPFQVQGARLIASTSFKS